MSTVLFALTPITGHVRPALPVMKALADDGHRVLVYTGSKFADVVRRNGGEPLPMVRGRDIDDATLDEWADAQGRPAPGTRRLQWEVRNIFIDPIPWYVEDLDVVLAEHAPDVVVSDHGFIAGPIAAGRRHLPSVSISVSPLTVTSRDLAPYGTGLPPARTVLGRVRNAALRLVIGTVVFGAAQRDAVQAVRALGVDTPQGSLFDWVNVLATKVLDTGVPGLEYPRPDLRVPVEVVGPLLPRGVDAFDAPEWWSDLLQAKAAGRPVVLVTQGTVATDPARLLLPAIEATRDEDVLVVATTGTFEPDELDVPGGRPANLRLARFVPFEHLLPLVDVAVTNGGWGGTQQALAHGVPVIVAGRSEDKAEVGARVRWSGAGLALRTDRLTDAVSPERVREGVRTVLADERYARRARELAEVYARHDGVGRTVRVVTALAGAPVRTDAVRG